VPFAEKQAQKDHGFKELSCLLLYVNDKGFRRGVFPLTHNVKSPPALEMDSSQLLPLSLGRPRIILPPTLSSVVVGAVQPQSFPWLGGIPRSGS